MGHVLRQGFRAYRPRALRPWAEQIRKSKGTYPTSAPLLLPIGAVLLFALIVVVAADLLAGRFGH